MEGVNTKYSFLHKKKPLPPLKQSGAAGKN
jgi:hypothetical protein